MKFLKYFKPLKVDWYQVLKMSTVAHHVPFLDLCNLCEKIAKRKGKEKQEPLRDFIERWRKFHNKLHSGSSTTDSFFPAMRLLLPQCERERAAYGIKEVSLAKLFIDIFCLDKNSVDAQKLINYRSPKNANTEAGDFASVAYFVLKNRCPEKGSLKIYDINFSLDNISTNNASKKKDDLKANLQQLLRNTTALEQKWLIRMILKDMKLGTSELSILKTFHVDARDLFNVTNSLEKVCGRLMDPSARLHEIEIEIFTPFRPMLSDLALPNKTEELMPNKPFIIEIKYDGERVQLHKDGNTYKYFSRGGHDYTELYGSCPLAGNFTPHIASAFKPGVTKCILDGEIVIYSSKLNCIVSKGENADVKALEPDGDYGPCFCCFDILMVNGKVLSNLPLTERIAHIKDTFTPIENRIRYTEQKFVSTNEEVIKALNDAIDDREEGIIIKDPKSIYKPNIRKGGGWLKVKPDYVDNLMNELDLLIIGGYLGEGRRSNMISHFLLAVASSPEIPGDEPKTFHSFCKVGSGYSFKELYELLGKIGSHWQKFNPKKPPNCLVVGGGKKEQPDVWIDPSKSQIVQVRAAEIIRSERFATDCTLRFPRVETIRYDKPWYQCMTVEELVDLRKQADGRLATKNYVNEEEEEEPSPKKSKRTQRENILNIAPHFRPADITDVQQVSELFKDKEFCVVSACSQKKQQMERQIAEHGGKCVQNPRHDTFCVVADKVTVKVKNIISTKAYDVVKAEWLNSCIENKTVLPWVPDDMLHSTQRTLEKLGEYYDEYGDSYMDDATEESLRKTFKNITKAEWESENITPKDIANVERYFPDISPYSLFRTCRIYIDDKESPLISTKPIANKLIMTYFRLKLYGADVCSELEGETTHVVVHSSDTSRLEQLKSTSAKRSSGKFHIVNEKWVEDSITSKKLLKEGLYMPLKEEVEVTA